MRARRRKARRIRRTVVALTVAVFIAAWLGIFVQMVLGKDPALSAHASTKQVAVSRTTGTTSSSADAAAAARRRAATPARRQWWREVSVHGDTLIRPPGLRLDSGGLGKGLFADLAAETLADRESFAVDCGGDLRLGGTSGAMRNVDVASPFDASTLHCFELSSGGVATSGIGKRSWLDADGAPAHHILDPGTGRPAFTGVVQVTTLAPTALAAETLAKAALLSGPDGARRWLPRGGVLVFEDGSHEVVERC